MLQAGPNSPNALDRTSYVGGKDIPIPAYAGSKASRAKAEEEARLSVPLVMVRVRERCIDLYRCSVVDY
jgi:hypothetical protein